MSTAFANHLQKHCSCIVEKKLSTLTFVSLEIMQMQCYRADNKYYNACLPQKRSYLCLLCNEVGHVWIKAVPFCGLNQCTSLSVCCLHWWHAYKKNKSTTSWSQRSTVITLGIKVPRLFSLKTIFTLNHGKFTSIGTKQNIHQTITI